MARGYIQIGRYRVWDVHIVAAEKLEERKKCKETFPNLSVRRRDSRNPPRTISDWPKEVRRHGS